MRKELTEIDKTVRNIANHGENLKKVFNLPDADPIKLSKSIFSLENKAHKIMTDWCNGDITEKQQDALINEISKKLAKIIGAENMSKVFFNGDCRGYTLKLTEKASEAAIIHKDWGGFGIIAPDFRDF